MEKARAGGGGGEDDGGVRVGYGGAAGPEVEGVAVGADAGDSSGGAGRYRREPRVLKRGDTGRCTRRNW